MQIHPLFFMSYKPVLNKNNIQEHRISLFKLVCIQHKQVFEHTILNRDIELI